MRRSRFPLLGGLISVLQSYFNNFIGQRIMMDLRNGMYQHMTSLSLRFFTNTKTGVTTTVQTNHDGLYRGSNLQPGVYDLKVTIAGFSTGIKTNITLNVGADLTVDFDLKVASVDQNVTVTGSEASVDLSTSSLSYPSTAAIHGRP